MNAKLYKISIYHRPFRYKLLLNEIWHEEIAVEGTFTAPNGDSPATLTIERDSFPDYNYCWTGKDFWQVSRVESTQAGVWILTLILIGEYRGEMPASVFGIGWRHAHKPILE